MDTKHHRAPDDVRAGEAYKQKPCRMIPTPSLPLALTDFQYTIRGTADEGAPLTPKCFSHYRQLADVAQKIVCVRRSDWSGPLHSTNQNGVAEWIGARLITQVS